MTERSESERAELVALADKLEAISDNSYDRGQNATGEIITDAVTALRRLAAQDQKPVAWRILCTDKSRGSTGYYYTEQLPFEPGENLRQRSEPEPLYRRPPPAAGWDEAIEACKKVAEKWLESFMGGEAYVARSIVNAIEALRTTPAATKSEPTTHHINGPFASPLPDHGGADAGVRDACWRTELDEIVSHLGAAITQSVASDDQIIMDHVKAAHEIAKVVRRQA